MAKRRKNSAAKRVHVSGYMRKGKRVKGYSRKK